MCARIVVVGERERVIAVRASRDRMRCTALASRASRSCVVSMRREATCLAALEHERQRDLARSALLRRTSTPRSSSRICAHQPRARRARRRAARASYPTARARSRRAPRRSTSNASASMPAIGSVTEPAAELRRRARRSRASSARAGSGPRTNGRGCTNQPWITSRPSRGSRVPVTCARRAGCADRTR